MNPSSNLHQNYLRHRKKQQIFIQFSRLALFLGFMIFWELSTQLNYVDSFLFSSPSKICLCFLDMLKDGSIFIHLQATLLETILSFLLVTIISTILASILWYCPTLSKILDPYLVILNSLPKSALAPLFIVWFGASQTTIIVAGISVALFGSILSLYNSFCSVSSDKLLLISSLGGTRFQMLVKIILPGNIPSLLNTMKVNIGLCLVGVIIGEFIGGRKGLGYLIIYGSQVFKLDWLLMSICLLSVLAIFLYFMIHLIEKSLLRKKSAEP